MNTNKIRVFVFSQQLLFRHAVEYSLSLIEDLEISVATEINDEVLSAMDNLPPDVAVVDIDAINCDGLALTRQIKQRLPNIGVIVLTSNYADVQIFEALKAQVSACSSKETTAEQLAETVRRAANGEPSYK